MAAEVFTDIDMLAGAWGADTDPTVLVADCTVPLLVLLFALEAADAVDAVVSVLERLLCVTLPMELTPDPTELLSG